MSSTSYFPQENREPPSMTLYRRVFAHQVKPFEGTESRPERHSWIYLRYVPDEAHERNAKVLTNNETSMLSSIAGQLLGDTQPLW
eukprot:3930782-Amphidinium_carterae.1